MENKNSINHENGNDFIADVKTRFAIATETTDDIVKGRKYELIESESMGHYIIDESGEETYYHHSSLNVC